MSDARWFEVQADVEAAIRQPPPYPPPQAGEGREGVELYRKGGFDAPGIDGYQAEMALMHALQSGHTSLEGGLLRILEMLGEEKPVGENWHADLITRVAAVLPSRRPAIISSRIAEAATETRRFRHRAAHNYDSFRVQEVSRTIEAATTLANGLQADILAFKNIIDPPEGERRG